MSVLHVDSIKYHNSLRHHSHFDFDLKVEFRGRDNSQPMKMYGTVAEARDSRARPTNFVSCSRHCQKFNSGFTKIL